MDTLEAVIGDITEASGGRKYFGALMLGVYAKVGCCMSGTRVQAFPKHCLKTFLQG